MGYFDEMIPIPDQRAETCAKTLVMKIGLPRSLHSDKGHDFLSDLFSATCKLLQVERTWSTPQYPQSAGRVERLIEL